MNWWRTNCLSGLFFCPGTPELVVMSSRSMSESLSVSLSTMLVPFTISENTICPIEKHPFAGEIAAKYL